MDFSMSKQQKMVRDEFAKLVKDLVIPQAQDNDKQGSIPMDTVQRAWELGASIFMVPEEYGGYGSPDSPVESAIILEEMAYGAMGFAIAATAPSLFIHPIADMGTPGQKKKYLPQFCTDSYKACTLAINEPRYGFDPVDLKTIAVKKNGSYILNGEKCFVPLGGRAFHMLVAASLDERNELFIVSADNPGLSVGDTEINLGLYALETNEVSLKNCQIPAESRLGGDKGCNYDCFLQKSRVAMSALATGVARASFDHARQYAKNRCQFGEPIAHRQSIAFMIAEMAYEVEAMRLLTWKAASRLEAGLDARRESYLAKLYAGEKAMLITGYGVQIYGGHGYTREYPMERFYRDSRGVSIIEGIATV
ncbi:MAG: acyl-CoA dehydrogenase family protein [Deltaproteobacteria bacterium]|nr:acyl-CoA dehydrogenase family protein [Deltaproteobacteria bacterium]